MADPPGRVVLVGFMGAGKSTVGDRLARLRGWSFLDMDQRIEEAVGLSVAEIFRTRGEAWFRAQERALAADAAGLKEHVIAAGGGAFSEAQTRGLLQAGAITVWLRCGLDTILSRIRGDLRRPLAGNREIMQVLLSQRETSYRLADLSVEAGGGTPEDVAAEVERALRLLERQRTPRTTGR